VKEARGAASGKTRNSDDEAAPAKQVCGLFSRQKSVLRPLSRPLALSSVVSVIALKSNASAKKRSRSLSIQQQRYFTTLAVLLVMTMAFVPRSQTRHDRVISNRQVTVAANRLSPPVPSHAIPFTTGCNERQSLIVRSASAIDALGTRDLVDGSLLAFALAFLFSFLQERRREKPQPLTDSISDVILNTTGTTDVEQENVFDSWKEMSRPENYVYYNNRVKRTKQTPSTSTTKQEKKWVLLALLVLFVPIFSAEFFLALSRQVLCGGDPLTQSAWAAELCSPHL